MNPADPKAKKEPYFADGQFDMQEANAAMMQPSY